jgi:hypothetical protein
MSFVFKLFKENFPSYALHEENMILNDSLVEE